MEEHPSSPVAEEPAALTPPGPAAVPTGSEDGAGTDRMPVTHEEWSAFAAMPPDQRAAVYLRSLRTTLTLFAGIAVVALIA